MLLVDAHSGSGEFAEEPLRNVFSSYSIPVEKAVLGSGDFALTGHVFKNDEDSPDGFIGIERKTLDEICAFSNSRFTGYQLSEMHGHGYDLRFLIVEGVYKPDNEGYIVIPARDGWRRMYRGRKSVLFSALSRHLFTLQLKGGVTLIRTGNKVHTAFEIANLYHWFQEPWPKHVSHIGHYDPAGVLRMESSLVRRVAMQLKGVGVDKSLHVDKAFSSVYEMALANEETWLSKVRWEQNGRNMTLGKATVAAIVRALRGDPK